MEEKQIRKYLRRCFLPVSWSLLAYTLIMNTISPLSMVAEALAKVLQALSKGRPILPQDKLLEAVSGNAWGYLVAIAVGFTILLAWKGWDFFRDEIFAKGRKMRFGTFCAITCIFLGAQFFATLYINVLEFLLNCIGLSAMTALEAATGFSDTFSMFLYAAIAAPIAEEILFRGFIQRSLLPFGQKFAIFGSAVLFGLFHGNLIQTPYAFLVGLILGYVAAEYSIWWSIVLHTINNMVMGYMLPWLLSFLPGNAGDFVMGGLYLILAIVSIVILILKRRECRSYIRGECMDRRCLRGFFLNSGFLVYTALMVFFMLQMVMPL